MKKILLILLIPFLISCGNEAAVATLSDPVPDQEMQTSEKGLSISLKKDTFYESPTIIETVVRNESLQNYNFGEFYHIEVSKDGLWYIITYSDAVFLKNPRFKDSGSTLRAGDDAHQSFSVEALGVSLLPGEYRLVKTFLSEGESFHEISVAAPFSVK